MNLASLVPVDYVTSFAEDTPTELIRLLKPDVFVKGGDWSGKRLPEQDALEEYGGRLVRLPIRIRISTTEIAQDTKETLSI